MMPQMKIQSELLNIAALRAATLNSEPFPYIEIPQFINPEVVDALTAAFPEIQSRGSIPADSLPLDPLFQQLTEELTGTTLRAAIAEKFQIALEDKPTMLTLRGQTTARDGVIHTDSKSKLITLLLYMNPTWTSKGGHLRLLHNKRSLAEFAAEIPPLAGSCVIFAVTPNCWHGHTPYIGKRLSLQLNYLRSDAALNKHLNHHRFTAWLKKLLPKIFQRTETY
jgi:SM-20-related protein